MAHTRVAAPMPDSPGIDRVLLETVERWTVFPLYSLKATMIECGIFEFRVSFG